MTEKMLTLTALTFSIDRKAVAHGVLIQEPEHLGNCTAAEVLAAGTMQMGALRREKGFRLHRAEAQMVGVGRLDAVFMGDRFLLGKKQSTCGELFAPLRRLAMR